MAAIEDLEHCPGVEAETVFEVHLYIYDLSKELSKSFKKILKGKPLPGIWHTGLVAYGREYYFASSGIESCRPGETILGEPDQILTLGKTELPYSVFLEYIFALGEAGYRPGTYNLLEHNCNYFCQEVSNFLTGGPIPQELRELPKEILGNKSLSNTLKEYFDKLSLRVEGSKGISFGSLSGHQERRSSSASDQQQPVTVNGDIITNGHSHPPKESNGVQSQQKSSKPPKVTGSKSSNHNMPSVNGGVSNEPSSQPKSTATVPEAPAAPAMSGDAEHSAGVQGSHDEASPANIPPEAPGGAENDPQNPPSSAKQGQTEVQDANPVEVESPAVDRPRPPARNDEPSTEAQRSSSLTGDGSLDDRRDSTEESGIPIYTSRRSKKYQDPPFLFQEIDGVGCFKKLTDIVRDMLGSEEKQAMVEILEYLTTEGGAWALGTPHLDTIGRLLNDRNLPCEVPVLTLQVLQSAALKEDIILLLHQDRKDHHIMSYLYRIENLPREEQEAITAVMCNLCCNMSSFDWLMYISEWEEEGHSCNNSKVTVRVAVHSLLCDHPSVQDKGSALIYNLALKELFDDTATELAMAVMQFLQADLSEELAFRSLTALLRFCNISYNDVPALMKMLGPDVRKFSGKSERVDILVDQIHTKLSVTILA